MVKMIICSDCGKRKPNHSHGLCNQCNIKRYNEAIKETAKKTNINRICCVCGKRKPIQAIEMCQKCYTKQYRIKMGLNTGIITKNKKCSTYLGCVVAETVLAKHFKNVTQMPYHNPGFDFLCGLGYMVDVKSSCRNVKYDFWHFNINRNKIADHFLCLAFDNRRSLNPLFGWLIPQKKVTGMSVLRIYRSKMEMWDQYRIPMDGIVECCDLMKERGK